MPPLKKIEVVFFRTAAGAEPVREWLLDMSKEDRTRVGADIRTVEFGWPVGMPACKPMGGGICEVRTSLKDRIARTIFAIDDGDMVLLHGFIKKTQSTPKSDIELARHRWRAYRELT